MLYFNDDTVGNYEQQENNEEFLDYAMSMYGRRKIIAGRLDNKDYINLASGFYCSMCCICFLKRRCQLD